MRKYFSNKKSRLSAIAGLLAALQILLVVPVQALGIPDVSSSVMSQLLDETTTELAPGVREKKFAYKERAFQWRTQCFCIDVDPGDQVSISLGTPNDGTKYGMQTVRSQANAAINNGKNVVAAVNGDYYNMSTGEPQGVEIKSGVVIHGNRCNEPFFGIKNDGTPIIGDPSAYSQIKDDLKEAIGGPRILVRNGKSTNQTDIYYPCAAVGIRKDNSVFFIVVDGVQLPYSEGITLQDLTQLLIDMGAQDALMLDGGGSSTCLTRVPGDKGLSCVNSPSDGRERTVANSILISSNTVPDKKFSSAYLTPQDKTYTPSSSVQMKAVGLDASGAPASLPNSELTWSLSDSSFGTIDQNGLLVSNGKAGQVQVKLSHNGKTVGTTYVEFAVPDEIGFLQAENGLSLKANEQNNLGLFVRYQGRDVTLKPGDIQWNTSDGIGTVDSQNIFHATSSVASGTATAMISGTSLSASISIKVGQLPQILYDFEDGLSGWNSYTAGRGEISEISLTSLSDDPHSVRFGQHALKLSFDLTNAQKGTTLGAYAGPEESVKISGSPSAIGMWVYATPEAQGYWLRMYLYDANGTFKPINFTEEGVGIDWTGWKYVEASIPSSYQGPFTTFPKEMVRLMSLKSGNSGPMTKGYIYVDDVSAVYGSNNVDTVSPTIDQIDGYYVGDEAGKTDALDGKVYKNHNDINIAVYFHDDNSDGKSKGINWDNSTIFVDGKNFTSDKLHFSYDPDGIINLRGIHWADGIHRVTADIYDGFGNETVKDAYFTVDTGGTQVELSPGTNAAPLGGTYSFYLTTNDAADVKGITANVKVNPNYPVSGVTFNPTVAGSSNYTYDANTGIVSIKIGASSNLDGKGTSDLATISVQIPTGTKANSKLEYDIESSNIEYNSEKGDDFIPTFSEKPASIPITAAYQIKILNSIVGQSGKLQVTDQAGKPAADAVITETAADGSTKELGKTGSDGTLTDPGLTASAQKFTLQAEKDKQYSFALSTQSYNPVKDKTPCDFLSGSTADPTTEKTVTWMCNPLTGGASATMQYAATADYNDKGESAFWQATGSSKVLYYNGDSSAVRENSVTATGLNPGTQYSYRVGDGTNWSEVKTFTTATNTDNFTFDVFGDTQSTVNKGLDDLSSIFTKIEQLGTKPLFTLHVGDFVDDEQIFSQADMTLNMFNQHPIFNSIDMIHVLGNHEYQGDDGSKGAFIYGVPQNGSSVNKQGCYSMNYGNMHISVIGWTDNATNLKSELEWLRHDVRSNNKTWNIVATHQPSYNKNPDDPSTLFNQMLPSVCDELGIDFVFSGHDHSYGRTYPLFAGKQVKDGGTVYICAGHTAEKTYDISPDNPSVFAFVQTDKDDKVYITGSIDGNTLDLKAIGFDGTEIDSYTATAKTHADKTALETEVSEITSYQQSNYTSQSWMALQNTLEEALIPYNNPDASQADVDKAVRDLKKAVESLVTKSEELETAKIALAIEVEKASGYQQEDYTEASWSVFQTALSAAEEAQNNENATAEVLTTTATNLKEAMKDLKLKSQDTGGGSVVTPSEPTTPTNSTFVSDTTYNFGVNGGYTFKITSKDGKAPRFVVGTPGVFNVQLVKQIGNDYYYKITAVGAPGAQAGIYINGGPRLLIATIQANPTYVKSDTTAPFKVKAGKSYVFKLTADVKPVFVAGTGSAFKVAFVKQSGRDYFFRVTAVGKVGQASGFYINYQNAPVAVATVA